MDQFLKGLKYDNPNFYNDNVGRLQDKIEDFQRQVANSPEKNRISLDLISLLIKLTSSVSIQTEVDLGKESGQKYLFDRFVQCLDVNSMSRDDVYQIMKIFKQMSTMNYFTRQYLYVFSALLGKATHKSVLARLNGKDDLSLLIQSMCVDFRVDRKYLIACIGQRSDLDLKKQAHDFTSDQSRSAYRFTVEAFFNGLPKETFTNVLPDIQNYYEHTIKYHNNIFLPYRFISDEMVRRVGYLDVQPKSCLYYNLPADPNSGAKVRQIIDLFKNLLIQANHDDDDAYGYYTNSTVRSLGNQIIELFKYNDPTNGYKIFLENWQALFDAYFEIFMKATRNDSRQLMYINLVDLVKKSKFKDFKRLNSYLLPKLLECTQYLNINWKKIDAKTTGSCLELYYDFANGFIFYVSREVTDIKECCKVCIDIMVELSKLSSINTDCIRIISDLLNKDNFYVLKDYKAETIALTSNLLEVAYSFSTSDDELAEPQKKRYEYLEKSFGYLKDRLAKFPESQKFAQECLFEKVVCKPIEMKIMSEKFFHLFYWNLLSSFEPEYIYSLGEKYKKGYLEVLSMILSNEILESIQPENADKDKKRNRLWYYEQWFTKLGDLLKKSTNFDVDFIDCIVKIIDRIDSYDNYLDPFDSSGFTINCKIIKALSQSFYNANSNEDLISRLIQIWGKLYDLENKQLTSEFYNLMYQASSNFGKLLRPIVGKLWKTFLDSTNTTNINQLIYILDGSLPWTFDVFMNSYSKLYYEMILKTFDTNFMSNYSLLLKLLSHCPKFYLQIDNDKIYLTGFVEQSKKSTIEYISGTIYGLLTQFIKVIKDNENFFTENHDVILEHRKELWLFPFTKITVKNQTKLEMLKTKNFSLEWFILQIGEVYYLLLRHNKEKVKMNLAKLFIDEILNIFFQIVPENERPYQLIDILKGIGEIDNKVYLQLIRPHREVFVEYKNALQNNPNAINSVTAILNLIDDRNLETLDNKINETEQNVVVINEDLTKKGAQIKSLDENVKDNRAKIGVIKKDVKQLNVKVEAINKQLKEQSLKIDELDGKTLFNIPPWCKQIKESIKKNNQDWILIAKRLNYSDRDIKAWLNQIDPFMSMLQEWFISNKTSDAIVGLTKVFKELNNKECVQIIMKNTDRIEKESRNKFKDYNIDDKLKKNPAHIFLCFEWSSREKATLLQKYLSEQVNKECGVTNWDDSDNRVNIWFDDGNMGGGVDRNKRIDLGLRLCNVLVCLITGETNKDQTCLNQINLAIQLNKPIIPLLLDPKLKWPPSGSLGPILSEYLFIRFFQRPPKESTNDERYWPVDKFNELTLQLRQLIPFSVSNPAVISNNSNVKKEHPEVFISYQWDKQKQVIKLYEKLTGLGIKCWLDIHEMAGGDSLYFKIDEGIRNCAVVISCVTMKYSQSANCRKEIALSDAVPKPIVPILVEKEFKYPPPGPMSPTLGVLKYIDFTKNIKSDEDILWEGSSFEQLMQSIRPYLSQQTVDVVTSRACVIS